MKKCIEILKSLNIVNLYRVMSMFYVLSCCVLSFMRLKMTNFSNLLGFALTVIITRYKTINSQRMISEIAS